MSTGAIKGAEVGFSNSALQLGVNRVVGFEREEESAEFKSMSSPRSPPIDTDFFFVCLGFEDPSNHWTKRMVNTRLTT